MGTPTTPRAELAAAIRAINVALRRMPESARSQIDPRTEPVEAEVNAAALAGDRDRALAAIRAWRGSWLDRIEQVSK